MITARYKTRKGNDPAAAQLLARLKGSVSELTAVRLERVLRTEGLGEEEAELLEPLFHCPVLEKVHVSSLLPSGGGPIVEVCYQRGVTDPELKSVFHGAQALKVSGLQWARLATRFQFEGVVDEVARKIVDRFLCNSEVETVIEPGEEWDTLKPQGRGGAVELMDIAKMDLEAMRQLSKQRRLFMDDAQLEKIRQFYAVTEPRLATDGELEMTAAAWGDHCNHTTMKSLGLLRMIMDATARINHPLVISAFDDNSGVMRFYFGQALNIKGETHISPSSVATYGGIMTKHGGVIRDIIFTGQGAWPWAGTTIMGVGYPWLDWADLPAGALHPLVILLESIRGTKDYTNPMGIPMAWSQYLFDPRFVKCFALGHSIGILPEDRAQKGKPQAGDYVVLIGGDTGNDGLHGATVSSGAMTHETATVDGTHVQIGMPIEERVFMEAIPVLRDADCIRACTDCGAAGLSSAVGEMGNPGGVWVNLAWLTLKCSGMRGWEKWLSESQERGVLAVPPEKLDEALAILRAYNVPALVIGMFTDTGRCQVIDDPEQDNKFWQVNPSAKLRGQVVINLPYSFLAQECPLPVIEVCEPKEKPADFQPPWPQCIAAWQELVARHLGMIEIADQSAAAHQYDQTVQGGTAVPYVGGIGERMPDELFAARPILSKRCVAGLANAVNYSYGDIDPYGQGQLVMASAMTKLVAAGFHPDDIVCNANLYTPRVVGYPENAWRLTRLVNGYADASVALGMPVVSGKDSCSGTFVAKDGAEIHAPLTLDVLAMGRMPDYDRLIPKAFCQPGDLLVLFHPGLKEINLGGSVFYRQFGQVGAKLPVVDLKELREGLRRYHEWLEKRDWSKNIHSRSAIAEGGLIRRLFEMCLGGGLGCRVILPDKSNQPFNWLFGELHGSIIFAAKNRELLSDLPGKYEIIGQVTNEDEPEIRVFTGDELLFFCTIHDLSSWWSKTFREAAL